jgi:zinc/manganese transport system substrate-binding protein
MCFNKLKLWAICGMVGGAAFASPIQIVTVNDNFASIASSVGGDLVSVESLVHGSRNMHTIQPRPSMVIALKKADLLIRLGMGQDAWVDGLIEAARNPHLFLNASGYLDASDRIQKLEIPTHDIDGRHGDIHKEGNPHYWLNPMNGIVIANHIRDQLTRIDPSNGDRYKKNAAEFSASITQKMTEWSAALGGIKSSVFLTYHGVWAYFFEAFNLTSIGTLELFPGVPPTVSHIRNVKHNVASAKGPVVVLTAIYYPTHVAESFATDIGAQFRHLPTDVGENSITTYTELFDYLVAEIRQ